MLDARRKETQDTGNATASEAKYKKHFVPLVVSLV